MSALVVSFLLGPSLSFGKFTSRNDFSLAFRSLKQGMSTEQVRDLLGSPDNVFHPRDDDHKRWEYGTLGKGTMPTLGTVFFHAGKSINNGDACGDFPLPKRGLISELDLRKGMNAIWRPLGNPFPTVENTVRMDPLRMIQTVNDLRKLGTIRAFAIIREYCRVWGGNERYVDCPEWLYWVERVLFVPNNPDFVFRPPNLGLYWQPTDLRTWPNYPMLIVRDVPLNNFQGADVSGNPITYSPEYGPSLMSVRSKALRPPDDPFLIYETASKIPGLNKYHAMQEILILVRNVYQAESHEAPRDLPDQGKFEWHHQAFLKLKAHWDPARNNYVR